MKFTGFHRAIALLQKEHQSAWPLCFCNEIRVDALERVRGWYKQRGQTPPSYTALIVKAIALSIREISAEFPEVNAYIRRRFIVGPRVIHVFDRLSAGVAISREENGRDQAACGILEDPDSAPLAQLTAKLHEYSTRPLDQVEGIRNCYYLFRLPTILQRIMLWCGKTFPENRRAYRGTFTLTSVGKFGVDYQLTLPQASSLQFGFGAIRERIVSEGGRAVPAKVLALTMSFDRRLMNGRPCAMLMERVREILQGADFPEFAEINAELAKSSACAKPDEAVKLRAENQSLHARLTLLERRLAAVEAKASRDTPVDASVLTGAAYAPSTRYAPTS